MAIPLPVNPLPGADVPGSTAEGAQANFDALAINVPNMAPVVGLVSIVVQQAGGLPINGTFSLPQAGNWTFVGFGSGYVTVASTLLRVGFGIDTTSTEADARQFINETFSHRALTPAVWTRTGLAAGTHTFNIHIDSTSTIVNSDDYFTLLALKAP